jgi:hypothetical protein
MRGDEEMGKQVILSAFAICMLVLSGSAFAASQGYTGTAVLAAAVAAPVEVVVEGVTWRCEGDQCTGRAERRSSLNGFIKDCRKVAEAVGPLVSYTGKGRTATKGEISTCNRLAGK